MKKAGNGSHGVLLLFVLVVACLFGYFAASSIRGVKPPNLGRIAASLLEASPTALIAPVQILVTTVAPADKPSSLALPPTPTPRPAPTVIVPTLPWPTLVPTAAMASPVAGTATAPLNVDIAPTPQEVRTPTVQWQYQFLPEGPPRGHPDRGCYVGAVFGWIRDASGRPLPGIQVRVSDPWGHNIPTITKQPPDTGYYDVILGTGPATYYVVVVDALGNQLSPVVQVSHPEGASACWYEVSFRQVAAGSQAY